MEYKEEGNSHQKSPETIILQRIHTRYISTQMVVHNCVKIYLRKMSQTQHQTQDIAR